MEIDLMSELKNLQSSLEERIDNQIAPMKDAMSKNQKVIDKVAKAKDISLDGGENFHDAIEKGFKSNFDKIQNLLETKSGRVSFPISEKAMVTTSSSGLGSTASILTNSGSGIYSLGNRFIHIRDLINKKSVSGSRSSFLREAAPVGALAPVAEGALKPEIELRMSEAVSEHEYIAGWTVLSTKLMSDLDGLPTFLSDRLMEAYYTAEDAQLIGGSGTSPQIRGIGTAGNFTAASDLAAVDDMLQLVGGISQLAASNRRATAILLSVVDYFRLVGAQNENSGLKVLQVSNTGSLNLLGIDIVWSPAVATGTYYVIDGSGVVMFVREAPRVEVFFEDSDNIRRNLVTWRCEGRIGLAVNNANTIIKGTF
jgi:HK97 family phage major capsid protein